MSRSKDMDLWTIITTCISAGAVVGVIYLLASRAKTEDRVLVVFRGLVVDTTEDAVVCRIRDITRPDRPEEVVRLNRDSVCVEGGDLESGSKFVWVVHRNDKEYKNTFRIVNSRALTDREWMARRKIADKNTRQLF